MNKKIIKLCNYLIKNSLHKEADMIIKISNQINDAWDQNAFKLKLKNDILLPEGVEYEIAGDETEACNIVNFGIKTLQGSAATKQFSREYPNMPENINFIHFDLEKLVKCMHLNADTQIELYKLLRSLRDEGSRLLDDLKSISSFLETFNDFPNVKNEFERLIKQDRMNFVLIGTSADIPNFRNEEIKATRFHQNTMSYVVHDFGHAVYNHQNNIAFRPIIILSEYCADVLREFYKSYVRKAKINVGLTTDEALELDKAFNFSRVSVGGFYKKERVGSDLPGFVELAQQTDKKRYKGKFTDFRYLVSSTAGRAKSMTAIGDFDQDVFSYIMLARKNNLADIFKTPALPPTINDFFDDFIKKGHLTTEDKSNFEKYIKQKHTQAIQAVQNDVTAKVNNHGGYINYLAKIGRGDKETIQSFRDENPEYRMEDIENEKYVPNEQPVFVFNMIPTGLLAIEKDVELNLSEKGYLKTNEYEHIGFDALQLPTDPEKPRIDFMPTKHQVYNHSGLPGKLLKVDFVFKWDDETHDKIKQTYNYEKASKDLLEFTKDPQNVDNIFEGALINPEKDIFYVGEETHLGRLTKSGYSEEEVIKLKDGTEKKVRKVQLGSFDPGYGVFTGYIFQPEGLQPHIDFLHKNKLSRVVVESKEEFAKKHPLFSLENFTQAFQYFHEIQMGINPFYRLIYAFVTTDSCDEFFSENKQKEIFDCLIEITALYYAPVGIVVNAAELKNAVNSGDTLEILLSALGLTLSGFQTKLINIKKTAAKNYITLNKNNTRDMLLKELQKQKQLPDNNMIDALESLIPTIETTTIETTFQEK